MRQASRLLHSRATEFHRLPPEVSGPVSLQLWVSLSTVWGHVVKGEEAEALGRAMAALNRDSARGLPIAKGATLPAPPEIP